MKYALLICDDETLSPTNEELRADPVHQAWWADLQRRGGLLGSVRLRPVVDATRCGSATARRWSPTGRTRRPRTSSAVS